MAAAPISPDALPPGTVAVSDAPLPPGTAPLPLVSPQCLASLYPPAPPSPGTVAVAAAPLPPGTDLPPGTVAVAEAPIDGALPPGVTAIDTTPVPPGAPLPPGTVAVPVASLPPGAPLPPDAMPAGTRDLPLGVNTTVPGAGTDPLIPDPALLALVPPSYIVGANVDYTPDDIIAGASDVFDIVDGAVNATTPEECAQACTDTLGCNGASWYGADDMRLDEETCILRTFEATCVVPPEAVPTPDVYLLIQTPLSCALSHLLAATESQALTACCENRPACRETGAAEVIRHCLRRSVPLVGSFVLQRHQKIHRKST